MAKSFPNWGWNLTCLVAPCSYSNRRFKALINRIAQKFDCQHHLSTQYIIATMTTVLQENDSKFVERVSEIKLKKWFHKVFSTPEHSHGWRQPNVMTLNDSSMAHAHVFLHRLWEDKSNFKAVKFTICVFTF